MNPRKQKAAADFTSNFRRGRDNYPGSHCEELQATRQPRGFIISDWFAALLAVACNDGIFVIIRKYFFKARNFFNLEFFSNLLIGKVEKTGTAKKKVPIKKLFLEQFLCFAIKYN